MDVERNTDKYLEEFRRKCEILKEPDGSFQQDIALPLFVGEYLNPNFYLEYPEEWKRAFWILLKHIDSPLGGSAKKKICINLLKEVFELEGDIEIEDGIQRVEQGEIIKRNDRELFEEGIRVFEEDGV
jgi:hypothetical protein